MVISTVGDKAKSPRGDAKKLQAAGEASKKHKHIANLPHAPKFDPHHVLDRIGRDHPAFRGCEAEHLVHVVKIVRAAARNKIVLPNDFDTEAFAQLAGGFRVDHSGNEMALQKRFPRLELGRLDKPGIVVDKDGRILVWYLQKVLPDSLARCQDRSAQYIHQAAFERVSKTSSSDTPVSKRYDPSNAHSAPLQKLLPGTFDYSPAHIGTGRVHGLTPHGNMVKWQTQPAIECSEALDSLLNAVAFFTHPDQYTRSAQLQGKISSIPRYERSRDLLKTWPSISMGVTWVINRLTLPHRDRGGMDTTYDYIALSGSAKAAMFLRDLGLHIRYERSDVVALTGRILTHEVGAWEAGDRVCSVRYLKGDVFRALDVPQPAWSTVEQVSTMLGL